jgi:hypothetical protein
MIAPQASFDWNAWYASIPGVPADWGHAPVRDEQPAPVAQLTRCRPLPAAPQERVAA